MHDDAQLVAAHWSRVPVVASIVPHPCGAGPPQVWKLLPMSMQLTQHRHLLSPAQAETSEQQLVFVQVSHAVSPVCGAQAPPELEVELLDDVVAVVPLQGVLQLLVMQALSASVVPSRPMHWALHRPSLPGCCARQPTQHEQFVSARHAVVSLQQDFLVQVVHAVSPDAGAHTPPELEVLDVLETLDVVPVDAVVLVVAPPEPVVEVVPDAVEVVMAPDPLAELVVALPAEPPLPKDTEPPPPQPAPSTAPPSSREPTIHPSTRFSIEASGRDPGHRGALSGAQKTPSRPRCLQSSGRSRAASRTAGEPAGGLPGARPA
jgi:hypothetical protein